MSKVVLDASALLAFRRENVRNRLVALMKQARVASGPKPPLEVLAP